MLGKTETHCTTTIARKNKKVQLVMSHNCYYTQQPNHIT